MRKRTTGHIASIIIDMLLLYAAQHVLEWGIPWITPAWADVLWIVNLSLVTGIVANALFLVYDSRWFYDLVEAVTTAIALVATYWVAVIYPFEFGTTGNSVAHIALYALVLAMAIATVVIAIQAIVEMLRSGWRQATEPK